MTPFVFELRSMLDWTVADTTLDFFQYLKLEDLYATNYDIKCCTNYNVLYQIVYFYICFVSVYVCFMYFFVLL